MIVQITFWDKLYPSEIQHSSRLLRKKIDGAVAICMRDEANLVRPNNLCQEKPRHVFITTKKVNNFHTYHILIIWCLNLNPSLWRICKYSGEPEYWVDIRETGEKGQERENKRQRVETSKDPKIRYLLFEKCRQVTLKYTCPVSIQRSPHWPAITHLSSGRFGWANAGCESQHAGRDGQTYGSCPKCSSFGDFRGNLLSFVSKRTSYTQAYFT